MSCDIRSPMKILITGAAGNLGSLLARYLLCRETGQLRLMIFRRDVPEDLKIPGKTEIIRADLLERKSLTAAVEGVDVIVHFAGVLFRANPEKFLGTTNTIYFKNLVDVAKENGVRRIILISFPHVEGPTSVECPAKGKLDGTPISVHAQTRLEEEKYLFANAPEPVSLRVGMVYGRGILMIDAARWLAKRRLLGVWKDRTQIHSPTAPPPAFITSEMKGMSHCRNSLNWPATSGELGGLGPCRCG